MFLIMFQTTSLRNINVSFKLKGFDFSPCRSFRVTSKRQQRNATLVMCKKSNHFKFPRHPRQQLSGRNVGTFTQEEPRLTNMYLEDVLLQSYLKKHIPTLVLAKFEDDLMEFGRKVATDIYDLSLECEQQPPRLVSQNAWGRRVDTIITSEAWKQMHAISAKEGLIALAYERNFEEFSRVYQVVKLLLFSSASGLYSCPLAMTDGAAKICEMHEEGKLYLKNAFMRLTSKNPTEFWTSGQWMTERRGGSDVAASTDTVAKKEENEDFYRLFGNKWFTSATDANMAFTLARIVGQDGQVMQGTKGLTMFYVEVRNEQGELNNIEILNLKNKLGTRQMPTAELMLNGTKAYQVSAEGKGISAISTMLTITRIHNAVSAVSIMRRAVNMASNYASKRRAFGHLLKDLPLHVKTLANLEMETRGGCILVLCMSRLLGLQEVGKSTKQDDDLLRILTPVAKLYTGKQVVAVVSECLECFGGQGYIEDTGLPQLFRDAQVLPIWEGTTNVLSLDILRCINISNGAVLQSLQENILLLVSGASRLDRLSEACEKTLNAIDQTLKAALTHPQFLVPGARDFAFSIARIFISALLINHASSSKAVESDIMTAIFWSQKCLTPFINGIHACTYDEKHCMNECELVFNKVTSANTQEMVREIGKKMERKC